MELLMLHDYAASLCGAALPDCTAMWSPPGESLTPAGRGQKVATRGDLPTSLTPESLPRLAKLLRARGGQKPNGTILSPSRTAAAALENGNDGFRRTPTHARPQSAGNRSTTSGLAPAFKAAYVISQKRLSRPLSAPGKRPTEETGGSRVPEERHQAVETVEVTRDGAEDALIGWTVQDLLIRDTSDLKRDDLLYLIESLRQRVDGSSGGEQNRLNEVRGDTVGGPWTRALLFAGKSEVVAAERVNTAIVPRLITFTVFLVIPVGSWRCLYCNSGGRVQGDSQWQQSRMVNP